MIHLNSPKGLIALDIDGTITSDTHGIPQEVIAYLSSLAQEGWCLIFITGRPFVWTQSTLEELRFPYWLAVQNGALILEMPQQTIFRRKYLDKKLLPLMDVLCEHFQTDYAIYAGYDHNDICYYRPHKWSKSLQTYLKNRFTTLKEKWIAVDSYEALPIENFAAVKCFAHQELGGEELCHGIEALGLHSPLNKDPFDPHYYVIQGTHAEATKGAALNFFSKNFTPPLPIIACGDDSNDFSMLCLADVKVVMSDAPPAILELATVIAPPAEQNGIIPGLKQALLALNK